MIDHYMDNDGCGYGYDHGWERCEGHAHCSICDNDIGCAYAVEEHWMPSRAFGQVYGQCPVCESDLSDPLEALIILQFGPSEH